MGKLTKKEAMELADFVKELVNSLSIQADFVKHWKNKQTGKTGTNVIKNYRYSLQDCPLAGELVKDGVLGYLDYENLS